MIYGVKFSVMFYMIDSALIEYDDTIHSPYLKSRDIVLYYIDQLR